MHKHFEKWLTELLPTRKELLAGKDQLNIMTACAVAPAQRNSVGG
jgi:hypothetical protein